MLHAAAAEREVGAAARSFRISRSRTDAAAQLSSSFVGGGLLLFIGRLCWAGEFCSFGWAALCGTDCPVQAAAGRCGGVARGECAVLRELGAACLHVRVRVQGCLACVSAAGYAGARCVGYLVLVSQ